MDRLPPDGFERAEGDYRDGDVSTVELGLADGLKDSFSIRDKRRRVRPVVPAQDQGRAAQIASRCQLSTGISCRSSSTPSVQ